MKKTDFKVGTEFMYSGYLYKIASISPTSKYIKGTTDYLINDYGDNYHGGASNITTKGFQFYAVIMGELFQKEILFKDCKIYKK